MALIAVVTRSGHSCFPVQKADLFATLGDDLLESVESFRNSFDSEPHNLGVYRDSDCLRIDLGMVFDCHRVVVE